MLDTLWNVLLEEFERTDLATAEKLCAGFVGGVDKLSNPMEVDVGYIASGWGYTDASNFRRRFRRQFGVSPSQVIGTACEAAKSSPRLYIINGGHRHSLD
ncbi:MAG: AraC family transcriptional regulator [Pseudomonadota bacterium]